MLIGPSNRALAAKVLADFAKSNDKLALKGGALPNFVMDTNGVKALASMPSRDELLSQLKQRRPQSQMDVLQEELQRAIAAENYERAAKLRDAILKLPGGAP